MGDRHRLEIWRNSLALSITTVSDSAIDGVSCSLHNFCVDLSHHISHRSAFTLMVNSSSSVRSASPPPLKRARRGQTPEQPTNGTQNYASGSGSGTSLPPLSLSILGVEPLDEFIKEIADFIHHMIATRPDHLHGNVEVEAKVGVLKERISGQRLALPVLVETSTSYVYACRSMVMFFSIYM